MLKNAGDGDFPFKLVKHNIVRSHDNTMDNSNSLLDALAMKHNDDPLLIPV